MDTSFCRDLAEYRVWAAGLVQTHERRIEVTLLDLEHRVQGSLTADPVFVSGEVTIDTTRDPDTEPVRILSMQLLDPDRALVFEPDSPSTMPIHLARMVQVRDLRRVPAIGRWVGPTVFTGPVDRFDREGAVVTIKANGKETLAQGQAGTGATYAKKSLKTRAVRDLLADSGETRMSVPARKVTLPERVVVRTMDSRWPVARRIASSMDRTLVYDGYGTALLRALSSSVVWTFDRLSLASEVSIERDPSGLRNRWIVLGPKPSGKKKRVHCDLRLPGAHPLSPQKLGRNGKPRFLIEQQEGAHLKTNAEARARAVRLRDEHLREQTSYSFDALPIPHLEEGDLVRVVTDAGAFTLRMRTWTLPLGIEGAPPMSVGSVRRTTLTGRVQVGKGASKRHRAGNAGPSGGRSRGGSTRGRGGRGSRDRGQRV